jgi:putative transposase
MRILRLSISKERNMFVAERFIADLVKNHGKHPISTEMAKTVSSIV